MRAQRLLCSCSDNSTSAQPRASSPSSARPPNARSRIFAPSTARQSPRLHLPPLDCDTRASTHRNTEARRLPDGRKFDVVEADSSVSLRLGLQAQIQRFTRPCLQNSRPRVNGNVSAVRSGVRASTQKSSDRANARSVYLNDSAAIY
ncbi:uncharacterized protein SCHCODRAFT_02241260 [Schizophyllum commune H4-8]|uniref:uncharacterized protein n=1 Tax=Schizophyllum commune (strain H4-8 / FGSC 9210) TaxID=578458 RepID=UPI002160EC54|nr:uncharacterized protein SCHCODRAFT_02241260 [Schizophyllum commune H4-8]KAI5895855.1 hypothetical protein SCHCODRAFT_02241260 [Schizophyllum commune H4-8]